MSEVIWKFPLTVTDDQFILAPKRPTFIHADNQDGVVCLWGRCDPEAPKVEHHIVIRGTGHPWPDSCDFIGTVMAPPFVWHVFLHPSYRPAMEL